ncbi:hypothetical protein ALP03_03858 [Pseudomonas amygdali pv. tabaci]|uniref:Uncharacterized protein n=1 Tax=Pseudomonas amygdali pv. tabaci TaxID=322 RepID=A0A3M6I4E1_PSEAJ|nr:hypothetical protein ALP03_03858 [Pseudomonas amygdali pv. tabaci]
MRLDAIALKHAFDGLIKRIQRAVAAQRRRTQGDLFQHIAAQIRDADHCRIGIDRYADDIHRLVDQLNARAGLTTAVLHSLAAAQQASADQFFDQAVHRLLSQVHLGRNRGAGDHTSTAKDIQQFAFIQAQRLVRMKWRIEVEGHGIYKSGED